MKRIALAAAALFAMAVGGAQKASAEFPSAYPFFPFGFYQPYGATFGSTLQTPPYFALNPPVYYGARFARPYGISPFASPPVVSPSSDYRSRLSTDFFLPPSETEMQPYCNPCVSHRAELPAVKLGEVRSNPFFEDAKLASK